MEQGFYKGKYIGKDVLGFKNGLTYYFDIVKNKHVYELTTHQNLTNNTYENLFIQYASEISIKQNWEIIEDSDTTSASANV